MTPLIAVLSGLLASATPAPQMAECAATTRDQPTLDARSLPAATFRTEIRPIGWQGGDELHLLIGIETATLPSGVALTVTLAGCENYSNSYAFQLDDQASLQDGRHWFATAARLMAEVEAVSAGPPVQFDDLRRDLLAEAALRPDYDFSTGGFIADQHSEPLRYNYSVSVDRTPAGIILTVDYWVPL